MARLFLKGPEGSVCDPPTNSFPPVHGAFVAASNKRREGTTFLLMLPQRQQLYKADLVSLVNITTSSLLKYLNIFSRRPFRSWVSLGHGSIWKFYQETQTPTWARNLRDPWIPALKLSGLQRETGGGISFPVHKIHFRWWQNDWSLHWTEQNLAS